MAKETKVIEINVNAATAIDQIAQLQREIDNLTLSQKNNKKETDIQRQAYASNTAQLREYRKQLNSLVVETANEMRAGAQKLGYLQQLEASVSNLEKAYYRLSKAELEGTKGTTILKNLKEQRAELQTAQAAYGKYSMNVGNYASATNMLAINLGQVMKEVPNFAISARIGIMSLTNNLPMLAEAFKAVRVQQQAMIAEGKAVPSIFSLITKSIFGLTGIMSIAMVLLQVFGEDIIKAVKNLFGFGKAAEEAAAKQEMLNRAIDRNKMATLEAAEIQNLYTKSHAERVKNVLDAEKKAWNEGFGRELDGLKRNKAVGIKYNKERLAELEKMQLEYFDKIAKLESDLRVAQERDKIDAIEKEKQDLEKQQSERKKRIEKEKQDLEKQQSERARILKERFDREYEEVKKNEDLKTAYYESSLEIIRDLEESFGKESVSARQKRLIEFATQSAKIIETYNKQVESEDDRSISEMIQNRQTYLDYQAQFAAMEVQIAEMKGNATYEKEVSALQREKEAAIFEAKSKNQATYQIEEYYEALKSNLRQQMIDSQLSSLASMFGSLSDMLKQDSIASKVAATAQATINTYLGATAAFAQTPGDVFTKTLAATAAVVAGLANVKKIWAVKTDVPKNQAAESAKASGTSTVKFHSGGVAGSTPDSPQRSEEITRTLLTTERVLSPQQTSIFDSLVAKVSAMGGSNAIVSGAAQVTSDVDRMYVAMSKALRDMPAPIMTWQEFERQQDRQRRLKNNAIIK